MRKGGTYGRRISQGRLTAASNRCHGDFGRVFVVLDSLSSGGLVLTLTFAAVYVIGGFLAYRNMLAGFVLLAYYSPWTSSSYRSMSAPPFWTGSSRAYLDC